MSSYVISDRQRMEMLSPRDIAHVIPDDKISSVISEMYPDKDRMRAEYGIVASGLIHYSDGGVRTFVGFKDYLTKRAVFLTLILDPDDEVQMNLKVGDELLIAGTLDRTVAEISGAEIEVTGNIFN